MGFSNYSTTLNSAGLRENYGGRLQVPPLQWRDWTYCMAEPHEARHPLSCNVDHSAPSIVNSLCRTITDIIYYMLTPVLTRHLGYSYDTFSMLGWEPWQLFRIFSPTVSRVDLERMIHKWNMNESIWTVGPSVNTATAFVLPGILLLLLCYFTYSPFSLSKLFSLDDTVKVRKITTTCGVFIWKATILTKAVFWDYNCKGLMMNWVLNYCVK